MVTQLLAALIPLVVFVTPAVGQDVPPLLYAFTRTVGDLLVS